MQGNFKAISLTHKSAPVAIRERVALDEAASKSFLLKIREVLAVEEAIVLSTCNRTEVYYCSSYDLSRDLIALLSAEKLVPLHETMEYWVSFTDTKDAVNQLFRVSAGLDSMVVGDIQITNQVKKAYQMSADLGMAGPFLHRLLHAAFYTNKKIAQQTGLREGAASTAYAAIEIIKQIQITKPEATILAIGLGEIGIDVVKNAFDVGIKNITICNRTFDKAQKLAEECGYTAVPFSEVWNGIKRSDIIISSVKVDTPFINEERINDLDLYSMKCFIDLSVPRSIEEAVGSHHGCLLYNIDRLNIRAQESIQRRAAFIPAAEGIIAEAVSMLEEWAEEFAYSGTIQKIKDALEGLRKEEIAKHMKSMGEKELEMVELVTTGFLNKIIKLPVMQMKAACRRGDAENLVGFLQELFNVEMQAKKTTVD